MNRVTFLFAAAVLGLAAHTVQGCGGNDCTKAATKIENCLGVSSTTSSSSGNAPACSGSYECQAECANNASCTDITNELTNPVVAEGSAYATCLAGCGPGAGGSSGSSMTTTGTNTTTTGSSGINCTAACGQEAAAKCSGFVMATCVSECQAGPTGIPAACMTQFTALEGCVSAMGTYTCTAGQPTLTNCTTQVGALTTCIEANPTTTTTGTNTTTTGTNTTTTGMGVGGGGVGGGGVGGSGVGGGAGGGSNCDGPGATMMTCFTCCQDANMTGAGTYVNDLINDCACNAGAPCNADCTTAGMDICTDPNATPSTACVNCIDTEPATSACIMMFQSQCTADAGCLAYGTCVQTCPAM